MLVCISFYINWTILIIYKILLKSWNKTLKIEIFVQNALQILKNVFKNTNSQNIKNLILFTRSTIYKPEL